MQLPTNEPRIFKADADARSAWVITLRIGADGKLQVTPVRRELNEAVPPDPLVEAHVARWLRTHEREFCAQERATSENCLATVVGHSETDLIASEDKIRTAETSIGNWVADVMRSAFSPCRPDGALINAGTLRLNQDLPAGTKITRRHVEELVEYPTRLNLVELTGEQLWKAMENSVSQPGSGRWLQTAGVAFSFDQSRSDKKVQKLFVKAESGPPIDVAKNTAKKFRIVVSEYMMTGPDDGYREILPQAKAECLGVESDLKTLVYKALQRTGSIAPEKEGRVCEARELSNRSCKVEEWSKGGQP